MVKCLYNTVFITIVCGDLLCQVITAPQDQNEELVLCFLGDPMKFHFAVCTAIALRVFHLPTPEGRGTLQGGDVKKENRVNRVPCASYCGSVLLSPAITKVFCFPQTVVHCFGLLIRALLGLFSASCMNYMCLMWYFQSHDVLLLSSGT